MAVFRTRTVWKGGHLGELIGGNGVRIDFSAPAELYGKPGVLTPEDAFVGALNMCFQLMFLWSVERMKIDLVSYECEADGFIEDLLDRTSAFRQIVLRPKIRVRNCTEAAIQRALKLAEKYSLIVQSIKAQTIVEAQIILEV